MAYVSGWPYTHWNVSTAVPSEAQLVSLKNADFSSGTLASGGNSINLQGADYPLTSLEEFVRSFNIEETHAEINRTGIASRAEKIEAGRPSVTGTVTFEVDDHDSVGNLAIIKALSGTKRLVYVQRKSDLQWCGLVTFTRSNHRPDGGDLLWEFTMRGSSDTKAEWY